VLLVEDGAVVTAVLYLLATVVVGLLGVVVAASLTRRVVIGGPT